MRLQVAHVCGSANIAEISGVDLGRSRGGDRPP